MIQPGIDVIIKVDNIPVAGQTNASFQRSMTPIDITNKITGDWKENIAGLKTWKIKCNGLYVINAESLDRLEEVFMRNEEVEVVVIFGNKKYTGRALITDYPLSAIYNSQFKYEITLLGSGALEYENQ